MNLTLNDVIIRTFSKNDSIEELTDLLHRSYKILADMGFKYLATHQSPETTAARIKNGICYIAEHDGKIIGTVTYYPPDKSKAAEFLEMKNTSWIGQMAVDPEWQNKGLGAKLFKQAEKTAILDNAEKIGLDTAEYATHLLQWYIKRGYKFERYANWDVTNYRSVVMIKNL